MTPLLLGTASQHAQPSASAHRRFPPLRLEWIGAEDAVSCAPPDPSWTGYAIDIYRVTYAGNVLVASGTGVASYTCNGTAAEEQYEAVMDGSLTGFFYCD